MFVQGRVLQLAVSTQIEIVWYGTPAWRKMISRLLVVLFFPAIPGCHETPGSVLDIPLRPAIVTAPSLELGTNDELENPGWATRLSDGRVVIADQFASQLLMFNAAGKLEQTIGRKGFGPGEFQAPIWISSCGRDSLYVWDGFQARMSVFTPDGTHQRGFVVAHSVNRIACSRNRVYLIAPPGGRNTARRPGQKRQARLGELMATDYTGEIKRSFGKVSLPLREPLGPYTTLAAATHAVYVGTADSGYIDVYPASGRGKSVAAVGVPPRRPTQNLKDQELTRLLANLGDERTREENRQSYNQFPLPAFMPAYSKVLVDGSNNVWVVVSGIGETPTTLRRLPRREDDVPLDVGLNHAVNVFEVGDNYILGSYEVDDQPRVGVFAVQPSTNVGGRK